MWFTAKWMEMKVPFKMYNVHRYDDCRDDFENEGVENWSSEFNHRAPTCEEKFVLIDWVLAAVKHK